MGVAAPAKEQIVPSQPHSWKRSPARTVHWLTFTGRQARDPTEHAEGAQTAPPHPRSTWMFLRGSLWRRQHGPFSPWRHTEQSLGFQQNRLPSKCASDCGLTPESKSFGWECPGPRTVSRGVCGGAGIRDQRRTLHTISQTASETP